jgi:2'-5' RNA ligase
MPYVDPKMTLQYALMLKLPSSAIQRIRELQNEFKKQFSFSNALFSQPHMTLAYWDMDPKFESMLFPRLEIQASEITPQKIFCDGFDQLRGAFCVRIEDAEEIAGRIFQKKGYFRKRIRMETMAPKVEFVNRLHITIARKLTLDQLNTVSEEWKPRRFQQEINADRMVLIKYLLNGEKRAIGEFQFSALEAENAGGGATQFTLF